MHLHKSNTSFGAVLIASLLLAPALFAQSPPQECPSWGVPYGHEFWSAPQPGPVLPVAAAIDRVEHAFRVNTATGKPAVAAAAYHAELAHDGFALVPGSSLNEVPQPGEISAARVRTVRLSRGSFELAPLAEGGWSFTGNVAQRLLSPEPRIVEHLQATAAGMEIAWVLDAPLPGQGNGLIEVELKGLSFAGEAGGAFLFNTAAGSPGFRVTSAVAVDKNQQRWQLPTDAFQNKLRIQIPEAVLRAARFPLAIDPLITPEQSVDGYVPGPSPSTRYAPAVAANDSGYLVVWTHGRGEYSAPGVFATRISPEGTILDPLGFLISANAAEQSVCGVAALSNQFLVVWSALRGSSPVDWDLIGCRILNDGTIVDTVPLPICAMAVNVQATPAVAANGENYLVTWRDTRFTGIFGSIVNPSGTISPTNGFVICNAANEQYAPAVGALGTNYLVAWQDYRRANNTNFYSGIFAARVTGAGAVLDTNNIPVCSRLNTSQWYPAVGRLGTNWGVVWEEYGADGSDLFLAEISPDGQVAITNGVPLVVGPNAEAYPAAAPVPDGDLLLLWQDFRDTSRFLHTSSIRGARLSPGGSVTAQFGLSQLSSAVEQWFPALGIRSNQFLAAWQDLRNNRFSGYSDIFGQLGTNQNIVATGPDLEIPGKINVQTSPAGVRVEGDLFFAWTDNRNATNSGRDIYGMQVGTSTTATPICGAAGDQVDAAAAAIGTNVLVVWTDYRNSPTNVRHGDIYGAILHPNGAVHPPGGAPICTATNDQSAPAVAVLGSTFLVVWQDARSSVLSLLRQDIIGSRISTTGEVLDPSGLIICNSLENQTLPAIASSPSQALVAWVDARAPSRIPDIYATPVSPDGTVLQTNGFAVCQAAGPQTTPAVATDGTRFLIAWTDFRTTSLSSDIFATFVNADGQAQPTNGFAVRSIPYAQAAPAVAWNGLDYLVAWQETRTGTANSYDIMAVGLTPEGTLFPPEPFPVNTNSLDQLSPAVVAYSDARFAIACQSLYSSYFDTVFSLFELEAFPRLLAGSSAAGLPFRFTLRSAPDFSYRVEHAPDLLNWADFTVVRSTNHFMNILDPAGTSLPGRFYRATLLP